MLEMEAGVADGWKILDLRGLDGFAFWFLAMLDIYRMTITLDFGQALTAEGETGMSRTSPLWAMCMRRKGVCFKLIPRRVGNNRA